MASIIKGLLPSGKAPSVLKAEIIELVKSEAPAPDLTPYATKEEVKTFAEAPGEVRIFSSQDEAASYEASTGKTAYWVGPLLDPDADLTGPIGATLTVAAKTASSISVTLTGAIDEESGLHEKAYSFSTDGMSWSPWQESKAYTFAGLQPATSYKLYGRVRSGAPVPVSSIVSIEREMTKAGVSFQAAIASPEPLLSWALDDDAGVSAVEATGSLAPMPAALSGGAVAGVRPGAAGYATALDFPSQGAASTTAVVSKFSEYTAATVAALLIADGPTAYGSQIFSGGPITLWHDKGAFTATVYLSKEKYYKQNFSVSVPFSLSYGKLYLVHARFDGTVCDIFVNGAKIGTGQNSNPERYTHLTHSEMVKIGGSLDGALNAATIWGVALSDAEIAEQVAAAGIDE